MYEFIGEVMAASEYQQILRELPYRLRVQFEGHPAYVKSLVEEMLQPEAGLRGKRKRSLDGDKLDFVIALLLIKAIIERIEAAIRWAEQSVELAEQNGFKEIKIGNTTFSRSSPQLEEERAILHQMQSMLRENNLGWVLVAPWRDVIRFYVKQRQT